MGTKRYAVIGNPISHSKSPIIHTEFAKQFGLNIIYDPILAPVDGFSKTVATLIAEGYSGANVTVPFKFEAFKLCNRLDVRAQSAGAVNTLSFIHGEMSGDNTDGIGLVNDIQNNLDVTLSGRRVLLMGAGGAAYGVALPLLKAGAVLSVANRTPEKASQLAQTLNRFDIGSHPVVAAGYEQFAAQAFDVLINATSTGLTDDLPPINDDNFADGALAYDMMYGRPTKFKQLAESNTDKHVHFSDGLGMLVEQAAEAFYIWHGVRPDTRPVIKLLRA